MLQGICSNIDNNKKSQTCGLIKFIVEYIDVWTLELVTYIYMTNKKDPLGASRRRVNT